MAALNPWEAMLPPEDLDTAEKAQAMAQALRKQQTLGMLGLLSGDPVLAQVGQAQIGAAENQGRIAQENTRLAQGMRDRALARSIQQQQFEANQRTHAADLKERRADRWAQREWQGTQAELQRQAQRDLQQARLDAMAEDKRLRGDATQAKTKASLVEVQDRYNNIKEQISGLKAQVDATGTQEWFGPENAQMDQKITSIATDMAKLVDPNSVARESEVAAFKKMLFQPSFFMQDSTAQGVLDSFGTLVDQRLENAYKVRGLEVPKMGAPAAGPPPGAPTRTDPATGETRYWNGKEWVK